MARPPLPRQLTLEAVGNLAGLASALPLFLHKAQALLARAVAVICRAKARGAPRGALQWHGCKVGEHLRVGLDSMQALPAAWVERWWAVDVCSRQGLATRSCSLCTIALLHNVSPARRPWRRHHRSQTRSPLHHRCRCQRCSCCTIPPAVAAGGDRQGGGSGDV